MLNKIKLFFRNIYIEALHEARLELKAEELRKLWDEHTQEVEKPTPTARDVVEQIFDRGIEWYDWNEGPIELRREAYRDAQYFLNSTHIQNVIHYLIATGSKTAVLQNDPESRAVRDFQMTINGIELLREELQGIQNPDRLTQE